MEDTMNIPGCKSRATRGTTLIELLIALVITGVVTLAIMKTYVTHHENYIVQDDVTNMQQSARACIDELTRQIRMAGHHLPLGLPAIEASNTNPDTITITYHGNDCETYLSAPMPSTSAELKCASDISCFNDDQWIYIFEPDSAVGEWFKISEVQAAAYHIQHRYDPKDLSRQYGADALLLALNRVKFFIDNTTEPDNPKLMVAVGGEPAEPYAEHIVDLQFQYRLANGNIVDEPVLVSDVREVLISISAQSTLPKGELDGQTGEPDPNGEGEGKRRTYNSSVSLRNIGA
jgi:type II secretory pathway pseudopilin PulG